MSRRTCTPATFSTALSTILKDKAGRVGDEAARDIEKAGADCAAAVAENARREFGGEGVYADGWESDFVDGPNPTATVHNSGRDRSLGHLLEFGHMVVVNSGRPPGNHSVETGKRYRGKRHIEPAYQAEKRALWLRIKGKSL